MSVDRRTVERLPVLGTLAAEVMVHEPMFVTDISQGGATIETSFPLQLDSVHEIRLTLGARSIVLKGRVTHSRLTNVDREEVTYRSGLEFLEVPERVHAVLADLAAFRSGRPSD
jgi:hypothetical protein